MRESILLSSRMNGCVKLLVAFAFTIFSVSSRNVGEERLEELSQNQTQTLISNLNTAGELMKRAGEFGSRVLWMKKRKFVFPAGTVLTIAPKITVPAFRQKPFNGGLNSDIQASWYLYMYLDKMGYTDDMHPFPFDFPPFYPFGGLMRPIVTKDGGDKKKEKPMGDKKPGNPMNMHMNPYMNMKPPEGYEEEEYKSGNTKGTTVYTYFPIGKRGGSEPSERRSNNKPKTKRQPRSIMELPPPDKLHGGERASLLPRIENMMGSLGFEGKGCMLRMICEIHEYPLQNGYGLLGEMISLVFSVSESPYAESHMPEYLKAEDAGRAGDCSSYAKQCAKSIFKWEMEKQRHDEVETNQVPVSLRSKYADYDEL